MNVSRVDGYERLAGAVMDRALWDLRDSMGIDADWESAIAFLLGKDVEMWAQAYKVDVGTLRKGLTEDIETVRLRMSCHHVYRLKKIKKLHKKAYECRICGRVVRKLHD